MTVEELVKESSVRLQGAGYVHGAREAEIILSEILGVDSAELLSRYEDVVDDAAIEAMDQSVDRRIQGEPVAYIVGNQQFMGWKFLSDSRGLIPRPETEQLTEILIRLIRTHHFEQQKFLEIGTGAGPIAISLKKYFPDAQITATDISPDALELSEDNAKRLNVEVTFIESDLFASVPPEKYQVIAANLPYVPTQKLAFVSDQILDYEPMVAIEAGEDGLKYITPFIEQLKDFLEPDGIAAIEMWHTHGEAVAELVKSHLPGYQVSIEKDLADFDRYAVITPKD